MIDPIVERFVVCTPKLHRLVSHPMDPIEILTKNQSVESVEISRVIQCGTFGLRFKGTLSEVRQMRKKLIRLSRSEFFSNK